MNYTTVPVTGQTPIDTILPLLEKSRRLGRGYQARCPSHEDRTPSLSVTEGRDGRALLHCHGGCTTEQVLSALGLTMRDLYPSTSTSRPDWMPPMPQGRIF